MRGKEVELKLSLLLAAMAQAVASVPPEKIDLTIHQSCEPQTSTDGEIVVCAHRSGEPGPYRIQHTETRQSSIPRAQMQISEAVSASADTEKANVGGFPSNRLMVGLKIKF